MPPRPLHRWKSFRLGLLVLAFLGWAWFRSIHFSEIALSGPPHLPNCVVAGQSSGMVFTNVYREAGLMHLMSYQAVAGSESRGPSLWRDSHGHPNYDLPSPVAGDWQGNVWSVGIAHWFLILLFLIPWIGWLTWRSRLMKRLAATPGTAGLQTGLSGP